ncbi:MAG: hypothetical protein RSF86_14305, partial [Angelakisella sp.]
MGGRCRGSSHCKGIVQLADELAIENDLPVIIAKSIDLIYTGGELGTAVPVNEPFLTELEQLSIKLDTVKGKRFYEYLPPELKQEVDDILHMAVEQTPQLEQLFGEYAKVQEQMIARYISTPERLSEKLSEWKEHFYHPRKKDLRSQHNLIIAAAAQLSEGRNLRLRAFEEQTVDVTTPDLDMSSGSFGDDGDDDGYAVCEEPPPLPTDLDDLRAFEEQNVDVTTPQPIMSSESFGDAEEYAIWEEPPPLPTDMDDLRAFEEQNVDVTMPQPVMSSILYENPTKQQAFEKQITDDFYQVFRKAMQEIFNPKVPNTSLQQYVVEQLEALQATKQLPKALGHQNNIFRAVYSTDEAYCNDVHTVLERMAAAIIEEQGDFSGRQHLIEAEESLRCGHAPSPYLLSSFSKYASRLDDQRYYQLLGAFRELNRPLNKTIHKALDAALPQNVEQRQVLADIADVAEYIKDSKPCEDFVKQSIRNIMESMSDNEEYSTALLEYKRAFGEVFTRYMPRDNAGRYAERFSKTYDNVLMLMRPHYTFVDCAEHLDDISYRHIMQDKELQHPLKKLLRCQLDECLGDEQSFSAVWVRRQLERCKDNPREASQLFAYLYETSEDMRKLVDNQIGVLYDKLKTVMSPAAASAFSEQYREELLHGQFIPIHNSINFYGHNLDENYYHVLSQKHKQI